MRFHLDTGIEIINFDSDNSIQRGGPCLVLPKVDWLLYIPLHNTRAGRGPKPNVVRTGRIRQALAHPLSTVGCNQQRGRLQCAQTHLALVAIPNLQLILQISTLNLKSTQLSRRMKQSIVLCQSLLGKLRNVKIYCAAENSPMNTLSSRGS